MKRDYCSKCTDTKWEQENIKSTDPKEQFTRTKINKNGEKNYNVKLENTYKNNFKNKKIK